jgi:hypothetical protein
VRRGEVDAVGANGHVGGAGIRSGLGHRRDNEAPGPRQATGIFSAVRPRGWSGPEPGSDAGTAQATRRRAPLSPA